MGREGNPAPGSPLGSAQLVKLMGFGPNHSEAPGEGSEIGRL